MNKNHCYIVAVDADNSKLRPSRVRRSDAKQLQVTPYLSYDECFDEVKIVANKLKRDFQP